MGTRGSEGGDDRSVATRGLVAPNERERLIAAMAASCARKGYAATEVEDVLAAAGVDRLGFERNFSGKAECALAAVNQILAETTHVAGVAFSPSWPTGRS